MSQHASNFTSDENDPTPLSRRDMQMARRAAREGWPVPMRLKQKIVDKLEERIDTSELESPWFDTAVSAVLKMTEQNIDVSKEQEEKGASSNVINNYFAAGSTEAQRLEGFTQRMLGKVREGPNANLDVSK